jgi:hypothetical protein
MKPSSPSNMSSCAPSEMLVTPNAPTNAQYAERYAAPRLPAGFRIRNHPRLVQLQNLQPSRVRTLLKNRERRSELDHSEQVHRIQLPL